MGADRCELSHQLHFDRSVVPNQRAEASRTGGVDAISHYEQGVPLRRFIDEHVRDRAAAKPPTDTQAFCSCEVLCPRDLGSREVLIALVSRRELELAAAFPPETGRDDGDN